VRITLFTFVDQVFEARKMPEYDVIVSFLMSEAKEALMGENVNQDSSATDVLAALKLALTHRDHGSMADSLAIWAFSQRYQIRVMVFQPPLPEILETVQRRNRSFFLPFFFLLSKLWSPSKYTRLTL
jgi:predicted ATPase